MIALICAVINVTVKFRYLHFIRNMASKDMYLYDVCFVGAGMIGSAAARHATLIAPGSKFCLVGPKEPKDKNQCVHGIFGAHYDEGRITRSTALDPVSAKLSKRSVARYRELEHRTGVPFFSEVGVAIIANQDDQYLEKSVENANFEKENFLFVRKDELTKKYSFMSIKENEIAVLQTKKAGHVSARAQIVAQQTAAHLQGCDIIDDVVDQVTETNQSDGSKCMKAITAKGQVIYARRVLLTTGAFTGFRDLLPHGKELDVALITQTVAFAELTNEDARRLRNMPCVTLKRNNTDNRIDAYILPPIKYPNGKYYLKIGHGADFERELHTAAEVADWYKTEGDKSACQPLLELLFDLVKDVKPVSTKTDCCVTTNTPTGQLYCDMVTPTLGITTGGCGVAARSADEIGRMAARMIIAGCWDHDLPRDNFRVRFKMKQTTTNCSK
ncbi:uncharacterized protein LOC144443794 [Glandiceps talaboti]